MSRTKKILLHIFFLFGSFVTASLALILLIVFYIAFYGHKIIRGVLTARRRFGNEVPDPSAKNDMMN